MPNWELLNLCMPNCHAWLLKMPYQTIPNKTTLLKQICYQLRYIYLQYTNPVLINYNKTSFSQETIFVVHQQFRKIVDNIY